MKTAIILILIQLITFRVFSQIDHTKAGETVLLTATIKNEIGEPINTEVRFVDLISKPVIARSNEDGILQAVLKQATTYFPIFKNYIEIGGFHKFQTTNTGKYSEETKMFLVRKIKENSEFHRLQLFRTADSNLTEEGIQFLKYFREFYSLNKNLMFKMIISATEMKFKDLKQTKTELVDNKKKQVKFLVSAKDQLSNFLAARSNVLMNKLKELNIPMKVFNIEYNLTAKPSKPIKKSENLTEPNAIIIIEKILNL